MPMSMSMSEKDVNIHCTIVYYALGGEEGNTEYHSFSIDV